MTIDHIIDEILRREGGFVDNAADRGGPTRYGITLATLQAWRGKPVTRDDVVNLSEDEARQIYEQEYIVKPGFSRIPFERLRGLLVDCAVNHGTGWAAKALQRAAGVTADGAIGPATLQAVTGADPAVLYRKVLADRIRLYGKIISKDHSQAVFAGGWLNRAAEFVEA